MHNAIWDRPIVLLYYEMPFKEESFRIFFTFKMPFNASKIFEILNALETIN